MIDFIISLIYNKLNISHYNIKLDEFIEYLYRGVVSTGCVFHVGSAMSYYFLY
jgi:hypothetical protein